jgi:hypothetical protein
MQHAAMGLPEAGIPSNVFNASAPLCACRLCGAVYQTKYHRQLWEIRQLGGADPPELLQLCLDMGNKWRTAHTKYSHTSDEVEAFTKTGWAFTPEAAHVLAPYGYFGMGNMHPEISAAMLEAPRAPDLNKLEG